MFNMALHENFKYLKFKKLHSFEEALIQLKNGHQISRYTWKYPVLRLEIRNIPLPKPDPFGNTHRKVIFMGDAEWQPLAEEILGLDWIVW